MFATVKHWFESVKGIMTELEDVVINPIIANGTIKFYNRFVDDTFC